MNFGGWLPLHDAPALAPDLPGVLQVRADALTIYPKGRSAMLWYACSGSGQTLRAYVTDQAAPGLDRAVALGARWVRFGASATPQRDCTRLLRRFTERFGAKPAGNRDADDDNNDDDQDDQQEARSFDG